MLAGEYIRGVEHGDAERPLAGIDPAPAKFWDAYETATPMDEPILTAWAIKKMPAKSKAINVSVPQVEELRLAA